MVSTYEKTIEILQAWFTEGGLLLNVEAASHPIEGRKGKTYRFRPGPNLTSNRDKFLAQVILIQMKNIFGFISFGKVGFFCLLN